MQDINMQEIIEGLIGLGDDASKERDQRTVALVAGASTVVFALNQLNATLEEIRDALKEK